MGWAGLHILLPTLELDISQEVVMDGGRDGRVGRKVVLGLYDTSFLLLKLFIPSFLLPPIPSFHPFETGALALGRRLG